MSAFSFTTQQDAEDRLTRWARDLPGGNGEFQNFGLTDVGDWNTYDGDKLVNGVLTAFGETRTHNPVHEIESIDDGNQVVAVGHDAKGNMTRDEDGQTYTWDFDNRLKEVRNANGDLLASHTYDALGRRTTTTTPGSVPGDPPVVTAYVCMTSTSGAGGMGQLLAEYEDNALVRQYTYGSYIDEPITFTRYNANLPGGEEILFYHRDRQYNLIGLTDTSGGVVERYAYTPYGERRILAPDGVTVRQTSAVGNPLGHQGLYHDDETGLIYNRARYRKQRWLSRDLLGYHDGLNLYFYLRNSPLNAIDPPGLGSYFFDGTAYDVERGTHSRSNVHDLYRGSQDPDRRYFGGPGSSGSFFDPFNVLTGADSGTIGQQGYEQACSDFCRTGGPIKIFGWSRGAVIGMGLAARLNSEGCCCNGQRTKPVPVDYVGLFDAVDMTAFDHGFPDGVPPNVEDFRHAQRSHQPDAFPFPQENYGHPGERSFDRDPNHFGPRAGTREPNRSPHGIGRNRRPISNRTPNRNPYGSSHGDLGTSRSGTGAYNYIGGGL